MRFIVDVWYHMCMNVSSFARMTGRMLSDAVSMTQKAVDKADEALHEYASKKLDIINDARDEAAMSSKEYADIEARRHVEGEEHVVLISDKHGLTFDDWERQMQIRDELTSEPQIVKLWRFLYNSPLQSGINFVSHAVQRETRGWDDTATWSLDYHLASTLGAQLKHLAATTHGWPQSEKFPTFENWQDALNVNGDKLIAYAEKDNVVFASGGVHDFAAEQAIIVEAQEALHWVADNLPALWD